ncbi:MAG: hypothetical protein ABSG33_04800 [Candidatus Bathyarchaeia archaeon]
MIAIEQSRVLNRRILGMLPVASVLLFGTRVSLVEAALVGEFNDSINGYPLLLYVFS